MVIIVSKNKNDNPQFRAILKDIAFNGCDVKGVHYEFKSIQEFADFLGVSRQTLGFWLHEDEKKRRTPDMDMLIKVSKALNMSIDYLVGLSENNTLDADIQAVARYTGFSEKAIKAIKHEGFHGEMGLFLSEFVEKPIFNRFVLAFSNAHFLASNVTKENKDAYLEQSLIFENGECFDLNYRKTMMEAVTDACTEICNSFNEFAHFYFDRKAEINSRITVEEIIPIEAHDDSEVK